MAQVENFEGEKVNVKVGDYVGFKCDIEQYAQIVKITGNGIYTTLHFASDEGFEGDYIRDNTEHSERASDCWID